MWKYVWFLSAAPYGLLLFIIQTVAAAAECENEVFFFFEVKMGELLDATCSFHSTTSYSPETYIWLLPIHPLHPLLIPLKFIFLSLPSNPALPPQTVSPQGTFLPWEHGHVLSKAGDKWRSQFEFSWLMTAARKKSQWIPALVVRVAFHLLNHMISLWLIRHMEALKRVMLPPQAHLVQLWGNGKCRVALLQTIRMWFAEILGGLGRKWFAEQVLKPL